MRDIASCSTTTKVRKVNAWKAPEHQNPVSLRLLVISLSYVLVDEISILYVGLNFIPARSYNLPRCSYPRLAYYLSLRILI